MMKAIAILLSLCLIALPALAAANGGQSSSASPNGSKKDEPKPIVLDLTPLDGGKYYILNNVVFRESNAFPDLQPDPFYSEGKKKIIEGDEKILA